MTQRVLRPVVLIALVGIIATLGLSFTLVAQQPAPAGNLFKASPVQGNIWFIPQPTSNVVVSLGRDGVMLVDSGTADNATKLLSHEREAQTECCNYSDEC